jgi:hypothetical protein
MDGDMERPSTPTSPTAALHILTARGVYTPHKAAMRLNEAIGANDCRLWGDGKLVDPVRFQTGALAVTAIVEADGRWRAEIISTQDDPSHPLLYRKRRPQPYAVCELDEQEVRALLPPPMADPPSNSASWAAAATRTLRDDGKLKGVTTKVGLASLLEIEARKAVKAGHLDRALKASYLENVLTPWGIWPLSSE